MRNVLIAALSWLLLVQVAAGDDADSPEADAARSLVRQSALMENVVRVPEDFSTIQAAVDAAPDGGVVLVAPGVYHEAVRLAGKSVCLASHFLVDGDPLHVARTIIDGSIPAEPDAEDDDDGVRPEVIFVAEDAGPNTTILGFTIRDGDDGIACHARIRVLFNWFLNNSDAIDYESGGGECRFNRFVANDDDAIDYDGACDGLCANNEICDNDDDGIEIRLQPYCGPAVHLVIRDNVITGNGEDGIQIIDYPELSDRTILIERNFIARNAMAGIGLMADANTRENYSGAPIPEPIAIANNTIVGNEYGITGGANALVANNVIIGHRRAGLFRVAGESVVARNLLWHNGDKPAGCRLGDEAVIEADPGLDADYGPQPGSPCIDAGVVRIDLERPSLVAPTSYRGRAPDLGAFELR